MSRLQITSTKNPRIKQLLRLHKPRERKETGLILIEGEKEIMTAMAAGIRPETVFVCPEILRDEDLLERLVREAQVQEVIEVSAEVFSKLAYRENSSGILAIALQPDVSLKKFIFKENPFVVVLEKVEKPGNLGAILRTADAAGVDAVLVCDSQTDIFNPNVIRASLGCVFTVPIVACSSPEAADWLKKKGIRIFATSLRASRPYTECDFSGPTAILMGAEDKGISEFWAMHTHQNIIIPMAGKADSMNVSVSTAIVVFEAVRQRSIKSPGK